MERTGLLMNSRLADKLRQANVGTGAGLAVNLAALSVFTAAIGSRLFFHLKQNKGEDKSYSTPRIFNPGKLDNSFKDL